MYIFHSDSLIRSKIYKRYILELPKSSSQLDILRTDHILSLVVISDLFQNALIYSMFERVFAINYFKFFSFA